jgi:hypothetical protein
MADWIPWGEGVNEKPMRRWGDRAMGSKETIRKRKEIRHENCLF